ncbi:MAG: RNA polymerase sigma-54 factor, partial [Verrucomicrobiae bacterium]|nr:RNA polymerase sigma-54 factor [Verrucomicrobiae bacterium]
MPSQGLGQYQKQTQTLVLAPQLRQSLKILQAPTMELRNEILEELQTNPALEELPMDTTSLESTLAEGNEDNTPEQSAEMDFEKDFEILSKLDEDWREHFAQESASNVYTTQDAERRQHFFDSLVSGTSLQEHLIQQAQLADLNEDHTEAINFLIGSLDDRGYLTSNLSDLSLLARQPLRIMQEAHEVLKGLDPPGIGAVDLQDCLLIQLKAQGRASSLAGTIVKDHFALLLRRRIPEIAKRVGAHI